MYVSCASPPNPLLPRVLYLSLSDSKYIDDDDSDERSSRHTDYNDSDIADNALKNPRPPRRSSSSSSGSGSSTVVGGNAGTLILRPGPFAALGQSGNKISGPAYCGIVGIADFMYGGLAGAGLGAVNTFHGAWAQGQLKKNAGGIPTYLRQHMRANMARQGMMFGGWLAVYKSSKCMAGQCVDERPMCAEC